MNFRPATVADVPAILDVQEPAAKVALAHVFPQETHPFPRLELKQRWTAEIADPTIHAFVSTDANGVVTGFAATRNDELLHFGTDLASWGNGLAKDLHDFVLDEMRSMSPATDEVWLRVFEQNPRARRFYEKLGWRETGVKTRTTFAPHPVLVEYRRPLQKPAAQLPERVEGDGVVLRLRTNEDVDAMAGVVGRNIEHLRPWMPWVADEPLSREARLELIAAWMKDWEQNGDAIYGIFLDGNPVGGCGLHKRVGPFALEIGYWVDVDHLGQGLATRAARLLVDAAFAMPEICHVEIHHDKANVASSKVPQRLGFTLVGERADGIESPGEVGIEMAWRLNKPS